MSKQRLSEIKNDLLMKKSVLGNSNYGFKEMCSDLINSHGKSKQDKKNLLNGTFLSPVTIDRLSSLANTDTGSPYRPQVETIERVLRYFGAQCEFKQVTIKPTFANKPKEEKV